MDSPWPWGPVDEQNSIGLGSEFQKSHALDAFRLGEASSVTGLRRNVLVIKRIGAGGGHQRTRVNAYGFPKWLSDPFQERL
ncbi:MAG: hypothetical protein LBI10_00225 [Deltaproteobacteria bacterium]|nr:hypothetical protein [Deltaproteobacteria bacterium]